MKYNSKVNGKQVKTYADNASRLPFASFSFEAQFSMHYSGLLGFEP